VNHIAFRVQHLGKAEEIVVEAEQALIGSAAHCDVRLPVRSAQPEHVIVRQTVSGVLWAQARNFDPPPRLNDAKFCDAPVANGSALTIGDVRIYVSLVETAGAAPPTKPAEKSSPIILIGGIAAIAMFVVNSARAFGAPAPTTAAAPATPPALWDAAPPKCPRSDVRQALAEASEKLVLAKSKRERRPFSPRDGVAAVALFDEAAACLRQSGEPDPAQRAASSATVLRAEIDLDYATHQVRLEHALFVGDLANALGEIEALLSLTEGRTGPYVSWLSMKRRELRIQVEQVKKGDGK
jgi:hypothetical protein